MSNSKTTWRSTFSKRSPNSKSAGQDSPPRLRILAKDAHDLESKSSDSSDTQSSDADSDDEHTLTAFGDISLSESCYISSTPPIHPSSYKPTLKLRVRRPPMPKKKWSDNYSKSVYDESWSISPPTPSSKGQFSLLLDKLSPSKPSFTEGISNKKFSNPLNRSNGGSKPLESNESQAGDQNIRSKGMRKLPVRPPIPKWDDN
ncbi:hypothetical protein SERLA73DRAFT_178748 [Serpula lacrymans var. lacrymans S7.3]|uniref:Uncharacterized protein n=2 Tax=Serpula lacrymans var. lacrymans TaxID=341189 RepID=F8PSU7_SERL3|nr:uncharacterized protein SERLADRAFT_463360 [Serpula lacrymans var. lacrymans S7.9]EGO00805.1 hypothetical protein SERLA73DRAFT_178748 [Serpula lacrymans var. lacrymans S7.3]EGO26365.1 hypothetical protein SERLADRAFT_463360 [Serpula lacrymans var. lacrymans S7.9]